jgi:hypothetical protein
VRARLQHIDHVALGSPEIERVAAGELAVHRVGAAVVINDQRVLLPGIEIGRQVIAPVDGVPVGVGEGPGLDAAENDVGVFARLAVEQHAVAIAVQLDHVYALRPVGVGAAQGDDRAPARGHCHGFDDFDTGFDRGETLPAWIEAQQHDALTGLPPTAAGRRHGGDASR